jgi:ribosomal protein L17
MISALGSPRLILAYLLHAAGYLWLLMQADIQSTRSKADPVRKLSDSVITGTEKKEMGGEKQG